MPLPSTTNNVKALKEILYDSGNQLPWQIQRNNALQLQYIYIV